MEDLKEKEPKTLATLILTLDIETKDFRIVGNVVGNKEATVGMLIQALHLIYNEANAPQHIHSH
jgi:hypothetical protein